MEEPTPNANSDAPERIRFTGTFVALGVLIGGPILLALAFFVYEYWVGTFHYGFTIEDRYEVELYMDECGTCFMDWPFDNEVEIEDLQTGRSIEFEFMLTDGPYLRFYVSNNNPNLVLLKGYKHNDGRDWLVDMENDTVIQEGYIDSTGLIEFHITHELDENVELRPVTTSK